MTWQVRFTPLADDDVAEAYSWYEASRSGLGDEFLEGVEGPIQFIEQFPEAGQTVHRDLRRGLLDRFPYSVYYRLIAVTETIEIRGCIHQSRHPLTWRRRA